MLFRLFLFFTIAFFQLNSASAISFSIKGDEIPKTKILFLGFNSANPSIRSDSNEILEYIKQNLKTTDLFEIINQNDSSPVNIESAPDFDKHNQSGIGAVLVAQFSYNQNGHLEIRTRLWDILDQRQLFGKLYTASKDNYRKVANVVSNEIFKAITGEKDGHFNSQITYISESGPITKRIKKLNIINFDGTEHQVLTNGRDLVLTPTFSKNHDEIFYLRYFEGRPQIFAFDLRSFGTRKIGGFRGTTFSPNVHPKNSNLILLSSILDGNADIYELNIAENSAVRLTKSPAIDTTPSYSSDGKYIAFSSDRESGQQIYVMDASGNSVKRISSGSGTYSKPVWSPDAKLIAFTKIKNGQFFIGIMSSNGGNEKMLSSSYLVEGARWSPNGRYLIFSKKKGPYGNDSIPRLYTVDINTGFEYEIPTPEGEGATDPDWN